MVQDLCFHIFDLVQNSVAAGAGLVSVNIRDSLFRDLLELELSDNGRGMDRETVLRVQDPFYTTKSGKKVGLGVPLLKQTALHCDGSFVIESIPGQGTIVKATFRRLHLDLPPMGNLVDTVHALITTLDGVDLIFSYQNDIGSFALDTRELRQHAGALHLSHPDVSAFLQAYLQEQLGGLLRGREPG